LALQQFENQEKAMRHKRIFGTAILLLLGAGLLVGGPATAQAACGLQSADNRIKHVVHIQFDNVHLRRDNPNVPSDIDLAHDDHDRDDH